MPSIKTLILETFIDIYRQHDYAFSCVVFAVWTLHIVLFNSEKMKCKSLTLAEFDFDPMCPCPHAAWLKALLVIYTWFNQGSSRQCSEPVMKWITEPDFLRCPQKLILEQRFSMSGTRGSHAWRMRIHFLLLNHPQSLVGSSAQTNQQAACNPAEV